MVTLLEWLNLRRLRAQKLRTFLAVVAVGAGVCLIVAVSVESSSVRAATKNFGRSLAGPAPLRVVGAMARGGLPEEVVPRVAATAGVRAAVPIIQAPTMLTTPAGDDHVVVALGVDCRVEALVGPLGCNQRSLGSNAGDVAPIVSDSLLRTAGRAAVVRTDAGVIHLTKALGTSRLDALNGGRVVVLPLATAQRQLYRVGRVDAIYVVPAPGTSVRTLRARLRATLGPHDAVLTASDPPPGPDPTGSLLPLLTVVALFSLVIGAMLIKNIVTLSFAERRRELAIQGALGATSRMIVAGAMAEAVFVGLLGGLLGVAGGIGLAYPLLAGVSKLTEKFIGIQVAVKPSAEPVVLALLAAVVVAAAATVVPARRATKVGLAGELHGRATAEESETPALGRRALAFGVLGFVGLVMAMVGARRGGLASWQAPTALVGLLLTIVGVFAAVACSAPLALKGLRRLPLANRGDLRLALANLVREAQRTTTMVLAIAIAVGFASVLGGLVGSIHDGSVDTVVRTAAGRVAVSTVGFNDTGSIDSKTPPRDLAALARVPGVSSVDVAAFVETGHDAAHIVAVEGSSRPAYPYTLVQGSAPAVVLGRGQAMVGAALARGRHLRPGSTIVLDAPDHLVKMRVGGIWTTDQELGMDVTVPLPMLTSLWGQQPPDIVYVTPQPHVTAAQLASRIRAAQIDPHLKVATPAQLSAQTAKEFSSFLSPFWALQRGLLVVALVAVMSTLVLIGIQRRREFGVLAALGMTGGRLARLAALEALLLAIVGAAAGALAAIPALIAVRGAALFVVGFQPPFRYAVTSTLLYGAIAIMVVVAGALLPAWRRSRTPVLAALAHE